MSYGRSSPRVEKKNRRLAKRQVWCDMADSFQCLGEMLQDKDDSKKSERVIEEMLQMKKIDIDGLNKSYSGCKR
jgi:hypothetical protein